MVMYARELGGAESLRSLIGSYCDEFVEPRYAEEMAAIARIIGVSEEEVLIGNLYYDALKFVFSCSSFSVDTPTGPLHARNLDWWSENRALSRHTVIYNFHGAPAGPFQTVGWPGFLGVLSGMAPKRFAVTLNAVLSKEPPMLAPPVVLVMRSVFESSRSYEEAIEVLSSAKIASDCLFLITGPRAGQMAVIERTPTRAAVRNPEDGRIVVTNDYRVLRDVWIPEDEEGRPTSCARYDRVAELLTARLPERPAESFDILDDAGVKNSLTVQQMAMSASLGVLVARGA